MNRFLTLAAERLGQTRVHLAYTEDGGPSLTGNADGLRYLSDLAAALSSAPSAHEHAHLYAGEPPLFGNSFGLTLYHEPDDWFDHNATVSPEDADADEDAEEAGEPPREIAVEMIAAIEFFENGPLPPPLLLSFDKLYRVLAYWPYSDEEGVWTKADVGKDVSRKYVFSIHDDKNAPFEIGLHLDDPDVRYFTFRDVEQFLPPADKSEG